MNERKQPDISAGRTTAQDDATRGAQDKEALAPQGCMPDNEVLARPHNAGWPQVSAADSTTPRKLGAVAPLPREMPDTYDQKPAGRLLQERRMTAVPGVRRTLQ